MAEPTDTPNPDDTPDGGEGGDDKQKELTNQIADVANKAVTTQLQRILPGLKKDLQSGFGEMLSPLVEKLDSAPPKEDDAPPPAPDNDVLAKLQAENRKMAESLKAVNTQLAQTREEKEREHEQRLRNEESSLFSKALADSGITGPQAEAVTALLLDKRGVLRRTEDGQVVWVVKRDGYDEHFSIEEGLQRWKDTDEGKAFAPGRGIQGSGSSTSTVQPSRQQVKKPKHKMSREEKTADAWDTIAKWTSGNRG